MGSYELLMSSTSGNEDREHQLPSPLLYVLRSGGPHGEVDGVIIMPLTRGRRNLLVAGHVPKGSVHALLSDMAPEEQAIFRSAPMVLGSLSCIATFAQDYADECGCHFEAGRECDSLLLDAVPMLPESGQLCQATPDDPMLPTLATWQLGFSEDAMPEAQPPSFEECLGAVTRSSEKGVVYYWRSAENVPVAMCSVPRRVGPVGCSLSLVFTDRAHRGAGYAEAMVRAVCAEKLKTCKFVTLLADRGGTYNTTRLYERCSFIKSGDFGDMHFLPQAASG